MRLDEEPKGPPPKAGTSKADEEAAVHALQYRAPSMEAAAKELAKGIDLKGDVLIIGIQQKSITLFNRAPGTTNLTRLTEALELKLPENIRPAPGVYISPSAKMARQTGGAFALRRIVVDKKTKQWMLGGYTAYLEDVPAKGKKGDGKDKPAGGAGGGSGGAGAGGAKTPGADKPTKDATDSSTAVGGAQGPPPIPLIDLQKAVTNAAKLNEVVAAHDDAVQFFLVPQPPAGGLGKKGGGSTTGFAGEVEGTGPPPNAPPWPVSMDGPRMQPADSEGAFSASINWAANDNNALSSQVISAVGTSIHYRWEVFDITPFARKHQEKLAADARKTQAMIQAADRKGLDLDLPAGPAGAEPTTTHGAGGGTGTPAPKPSAPAGAGTAGTTVTPPTPSPETSGTEPNEKTYDDVIAEKARSKAGSGEDPTAAARNRKFRRSFEELYDDTARAADDLVDPKGSTRAERQSNMTANLISIELLPVSAVITSLGSSLRWLADLFAGETNNQEINFEREGVYLVRVVTTPSVGTDRKGNEVRRPSSVATRVVEVVKMERMVQEALDDPKAQLAKAELDLANAKKTKDEAKIKAAQAAFDLKALETEGDPIKYVDAKIKAKQAELVEVKKRYEGIAVGPILKIEREIKILEERKGVFEFQEADRVAGVDTVVPPQRVNASLVSEVTGQTYPLMLSVGPTKPEGNRHVWKLLDATSEDSVGISGYGDTPSHAIQDAFRQYGGRAQFGRGKIGVRIPDSIPLEAGAKRDFRVDSKPTGWNVARARLDDLVMTLAALGLFVASAGTASVAIGAAVAAARLVDRYRNGTLRFDAAAVTDVLAILGAAGAAAQGVQQLRVAAAGVKFEKVGAQMVMLEEGAMVTLNEVKAAEKAMENAADFLGKIEKANEVLNYAGIIWGNVTFFNDMFEIAALEAQGPPGGITKAEARRRRWSGLAGAANNNLMAVAPAAIKAIKDAKAAKATSKTGAPSESKGPAPEAKGPHGEAEPTPKPDTGPAPGEPTPTVRPEGGEVRPAGGPDEAGGGAKKPGADEGSPAPRENAPAGRPGTGEGPAGRTETRPSPGTGADARPGGEAKPGAKPAEPAAPKPGSAQERAVVHKALHDAARSGGDLAGAAENVIGKGGSWKEGLKGAVSKLEGDHRVAAEKALVDARDRIVNEEWAKIAERYPGLTLENPGTKSFSSDIDATIRPKNEAKATGPEMARQVEDAARASKELSDALRHRVGGETDIVIDTNIYSFIGEGRVNPTDPAGKGAQQHVDIVVGLAEQMRGQTGREFKAFEQQLLEGTKDPRVADEARRVLGQAKEFHDARGKEWRDALTAAGVKRGEKPTPEQAREAREAILGNKKSELGGLLGVEKPNFDAVARKQSEINWFAPDAYATPSAFKQAVAHGQRLKGAAKPATEWTAGEVAGKLREAAGKLPAEHPQRRQYELEAGRVESQQRLLEMTVKELRSIQENAPVDVARVKDLEARAKGLRDAIAHSAEQLVIAQILGETMPAGRPSADRLSEAAAASGANTGLLEAHVESAKDVDGKVKAAAKYAGRIAMAEFLGGLRPGMDPIARLIGEFVKSRWGFLENASPQVMRDMFVRYARLTGRHTELTYNSRGEAVGASDALKQRFVNEVIDWARTTNREIQQQAIGMKAFDNPTPTTPSLPGAAEPTPKPGGGGPEGGPKPSGGPEGGPKPGGGEVGAPARAPGGGQEHPAGRTPAGPDPTPAGPAEQPGPREPIKISKAGGLTKPGDSPTINPPGVHQPFEFRISTLRDAEAAIRGIANGDIAPLKDRGVALPEGYKTQGREWGLAQMPDGTFAIVQGDHGGVAWGDLPRGAIPLAHTHPITPERALSRPATVAELIEHVGKNNDDPREMDALHVFQSGEDVLLLAANGIANHDVHTGYVHTGDGVLKNPTGAKGEMQVSFNLYEARHIGNHGHAPVVEAAFVAHDDAGNVLHVGRVWVMNLEPNMQPNPNTIMSFKPIETNRPADPASLLPMHATPMAQSGGPGGKAPTAKGEGAGAGEGARGTTEDTGPATRREDGAPTTGGAPVTGPQRPGPTAKQEPAPGGPQAQERVPGGFRVESDEYSTTVKSRKDPNALARIEKEGGGVWKMTDVQKRDLPSGSGAGLLAEALLEVKAKPGDTLIIHGIINKPTLAVHEAGGDPATSVLGKMGQRALEGIGLAPRTMTWEIIRGKLCIVVRIQ